MLDLYSGLNGWGDPFRDTGHEVFSIDVDRRFTADAYLDIGDVGALLDAVPWRPDVIFASPPCRSFSMMQASAWRKDDEPRKPAAFEGRRLVLATMRLIAAQRPEYWVIENPRARLRTVGLLDGFERRTEWMCRLGLDRAKPTDRWGVFPPGLELPPECHNRQPDRGPECTCHDHVSAPRGSRTGTQGGVSTAEAGKIPRELAERFRAALEQAA